MRLTEEEAKTKRCQESFGQFYVTPNGEGVHTPIHTAMAFPGAYGGSYAAVTSGPQLPTVASPSMCIASRCMAWEWAADRTIDGHFTGFCGKARRLF